MFTTNNEKQAVRALQTFEQVRYFFAQFSHAKQAPDGLVRVVAFSSEKEYKPYSRSGAFAYYLQSRQRDYIVMQDIAAEHSQAAFHEYTHLVIRHLNLQLPTWLNEGLADFYSSLEADGDHAVVGRPIPGRIVTLFNERWIDWTVLFRVDQNSPYYNEASKMSIFYAQSWALTHMLVTGDGYRQSFPRFLAAVAGGDSSEHALQAIYGKSLRDIDTDLHKYVRARTVKALVFDVKLTKSDLQPEVGPLPDLERELVLADLMAAQPARAAQAKSVLDALAGKYPQSPEVQESLGYLLWQQGNVEQARAHFGTAFELHSQDPKMLLSYAQMLSSAGGSPPDVMKVLEYALILDPTDSNVRLQLAAAALNNKQYGYALSVLSEFKSVRPEHACQFFTMQAYALVNLHQEDAAKADAQKALEYAKTPAERTRLLDLLSYLNHRQQPSWDFRQPITRDERPKESANTSGSTSKAPHRSTIFISPDWQIIKGRTKELECTAKGLRFHLQAGDHEMIFAIPDPTQIVVSNAGVNTIQWSCGPLSPRDVTVFYDSAGAEANVTSGELKQLVF